jgi:hypothetical protein
MQCDGKLPSCTQCRLTGRQCGGYKLDVVFVPYSAKPHPKSSKKSLSPVNLLNVDSAARIISQNNTGNGSRQVRPCQIFRPIDAASSDEFTAVIIGCFMPRFRKNLSSFDTSTSQVCGSWVEMLPSIVARARSGDLITAATRAFGTILLDRGPEGKHKSFHSIEAYVATLQKLKSALHSSESFFRIETAAAIVCLAMVEVRTHNS